MSNYTNTTYGTAGTFTVVTSANNLSGDNSPRVGGKLRLRANAVSSVKGRVTHNSWNTKESSSPFSVLSALGSQFPDFAQAENAAASRCKERWNGNLRQGSASLGVTIAQYSKTRDMVTEKVKVAGSLFDADYRRATLSVHEQAKKLAKEAKRAGVLPGTQLFRNAGSRYLEGIFGWAPLIADAQALTGSVFSKAIPPMTNSAGYNSSYTKRFENDSTSSNSKIEMEAAIRVRCQGFTTITNPNANLVSRTGVSDLLGVAWDIIPWSFVAGMFVNVGAMLSDIKGFPGVSITNTSTTVTSTILVTQSRTRKGQNGYSSAFNYVRIQKKRTLGLPTVGFRTKSPSPSMGLAAMGVSLMAQKVGAYQRTLLKLARSY